MLELVYLLLNYFLFVLVVLITLSFLTLLERKVLGYIQFRKGPNKVGFIGVLQPFSDAIKLFRKERILFNSVNKYLYVMRVIILLIFILMGWVLMLVFVRDLMFDLSLVYLFVFLGLGVYLTIFMGWSSNSIYSRLGTLRGIVQRVSYEIRLILIITLLIFLEKEFRFFFIENRFGVFSWLFNFNRVLAYIFFISLLGELNRTPFDFLEGESELVSGFNIEYSRGLFALIFMAEYGIIVFIRILWVYFFLGGYVFILLRVRVVLLTFIVVWVRGVLPRMRYDFMIIIFWKIFLPVVLFYYFLIIGGLDFF